VCVFPVNGTRRWFALEHAAEMASGGVQAYFRIVGRAYIDLFRLFFDHGIDTLLSPVFGSDLLSRGGEYHKLIVPHGLLWLAHDPEFLSFYDEYDVRVRVYGDARRHFSGGPNAHVLEAFDELAQRTASHRRCRLFLGVFADQASETVAEIAVQHYRASGRLPDHRQIVEAYFGEYVPPANLFVGFEPPAVFDMPLIATGAEDLYFTVSPSPYVDAITLRSIIFDHLYSRRAGETYDQLSTEDWQVMGDFYRSNRHHVLGIGRRHPTAGFWFPLPQVDLPSGDNGRRSVGGRFGGESS
jgi:tuberculosinol/isotuberculosinol synthase